MTMIVDAQTLMAMIVSVNIVYVQAYILKMKLSNIRKVISSWPPTMAGLRVIHVRYALIMVPTNRFDTASYGTQQT